MSKSLGNVISPDDVIKKYGADILRLWVVASDYSDDLKIDESILEQHSQSYRKIRNTFRFLLGNLNDKVEFDNSINIDNFDEIEKYILHKISSMDVNFEILNKNYNYHKIYIDLLNFCTLDLSALYFDIRKDTLYCDDVDSKKRKNCIKVLSVILEFLLKWFSPILVFTCEEVYQIIRKEYFPKSIFLHPFLKFSNGWIDSQIETKWNYLKILRSDVNNAIEQIRNEKTIGSSLEVNVHLKIDKSSLLDFKTINFSELFICSNATLNNNNLEFDELASYKSNLKDIKIYINKSEGQKCNHCWKILPKKCNRKNCGIS